MSSSSSLDIYLIILGHIGVFIFIGGLFVTNPFALYIGFMLIISGFGTYLFLALYPRYQYRKEQQKGDPDFSSMEFVFPNHSATSKGESGFGSATEAERDRFRKSRRNYSSHNYQTTHSQNQKQTSTTNADSQSNQNTNSTDNTNNTTTDSNNTTSQTNKNRNNSRTKYKYYNTYQSQTDSDKTNTTQKSEYSSEKQILGLQSPFTATELKQAYRSQVKETHPDTSENETTDEFKKVKNAYHVLLENEVYISD